VLELFQELPDGPGGGASPRPPARGRSRGGVLPARELGQEDDAVVGELGHSNIEYVSGPISDQISTLSTNGPAVKDWGPFGLAAYCFGAVAGGAGAAT